MFNLPIDLTYSGASAGGGVAGAGGDITDFDPEEGFQSSFTKLGASESKTHDPVSDVQDPKRFASAELSRRSKEKPGVVGGLIQQAKVADAEAIGGWEVYMAQNG